MPKRSSALLWLLVPVLWTGASSTAFGRPACSVSEEPQWDGTTLKMECSDGKEITEYLEKSACGGFAKDRSVVGDKVDSVEDRDNQRSALLLGSPSYIAKVTGLPGREGYPMGQYEYGMAKRVETGGRYDDGFQFPDDAEGTTTTCAPGYPDTTKWVFHCQDGSPDGTPGCWGERRDRQMGYPYFQDPICRWRIKGGNTTYNPPKYTPGDFEEIDGGEDPPGQTPGLCRETKDYLNRWQYFDCLVSHWDFDIEESVCDCWGDRYICNDHAVQGSAYGACPAFEDFPNAKDCTGEECRCSGATRENQCIRTTAPPDWVGPDNLPYRSYFRQYAGSYEREKLDLAADDKNEENGVPVACYGFYDEFDPKTRRTSTADYRCVIDMETKDREDSQKGRGEFSAPMADVGLEPADEFEDDKDSWWQLLAGGFSHLSPKEDNLSLALSNFAPAKTRGVPQAQGDDTQGGWSLNALSRDIDDTGPLGSVTRWWHKQQTAASTLFTPPTLRLVHVPAWAMGLGADNSLFATGSSSSSSSAVSQWAGFRERPIDDQIHAREDLIGEVLHFIHRSIFSVEEVPLPVVVPMGSPGEFRARAQTLCAWYITNNPSTKNCKDVSGKAKQIMDKLEAYATRIESVRTLRNQLTVLAGDLLASQKGVLEPLYAWSEKNLETYEAFLQERDRVLALSEQWSGIQRQFWEVHEKTNAPWCMNHRFTTAIYSLLDPWMTSRPSNTEYAGITPIPLWDPDVVGGDGEPDGLGLDLPTFDTVPLLQQPDIVMDLSIFQTIRLPLQLPVLKPVQVQLDLNRYLPPQGDDEDALPDPPPDLPDMELVLQTVRDAREALPKVCGPKVSSASAASSAPPGSAGSASSFSCPNAQMALQAQKPTFWTPAQRAEITSVMGEIGSLVGGMNQAYKDFWESLNPEDDEKKEEEKDKLKCRNWHAGVCMHVEMDLLERFTRIGSRPAVLLAEDYRSHGKLRSFGGVCLPDDDACQLLNPETVYPRAGWQVTQGSSSSTNGATPAEMRLRSVRARLRDMSLPVPVGGVAVEAFPPYNVSPLDLLQIFETPRAIDLVPPASSSASSS